MGDQLDKLAAGAEIVVGTPGRIYDHIRRKTLRLDDVLACCLDEADEMLNMGFFEEVTRILDHLPDDCQQLLFSATVPADIEQIIREYLTEPETIMLSGDEYQRREHPQRHVPDGRRVPEAAQPPLHDRDGGAGDGHRLLQHPQRHHAGGRRPQPERLRRRAPQRRPAAEGARAGHGQGEARRGALHGGDRHRRPRHRHLRPLPRHQLLVARGSGGLPPPGRAHRPHREEGDQPLARLGRRHPHAQRASEEVRASPSRRSGCPRPRRPGGSGPTGTWPSSRRP